eukprot:1367959-Amorphochlora_amoeboformis.AAC.1
MFTQASAQNENECFSSFGSKEGAGRARWILRCLLSMLVLWGFGLAKRPRKLTRGQIIDYVTLRCASMQSDQPFWVRSRGEDNGHNIQYGRVSTNALSISVLRFGCRVEIGATTLRVLDIYVCAYGLTFLLSDSPWARLRGGGGGYHNFMNHKPWHPGRECEEHGGGVDSRA